MGRDRSMSGSMDGSKRCKCMVGSWLRREGGLPYRPPRANFSLTVLIAAPSAWQCLDQARLDVGSKVGADAWAAAFRQPALHCLAATRVVRARSNSILVVVRVATVSFCRPFCSLRAKLAVTAGIVCPVLTVSSPRRPTAQRRFACRISRSREPQHLAC